MPGEEQEAPATGPAAGLALMPTGAKLFLILSAALLPLALIGVFATLQTTRTADLEARSRLRVAAAEAARTLAIELSGDLNALRVALAAVTASPDPLPGCARAQGVFAQQAETGVRFVISRAGRVVCGDPLPVLAEDMLGDRPPLARIVRGEGLVLTVAGQGGTAAAFFPTAFLRQVARPTGFLPRYGTRLEQEGLGDLELAELDTPALTRVERSEAAIGLGGLSLEMHIRSAPLTSPVLVAMLLPVLMWAAAAGIGWFVVDRLLIRPLQRLRRDVAAYRPGGELSTTPPGAIPAQEIRELGDTFRAISRTVRLHEADLAEGLVRQTKLTREVHHRVKNNLQVIASLINFHARGAVAPEAVAAYSSIQRRVDALAVVHRHHFAEQEENRGLSLRSVLGELASNLRATAPEEGGGPTILLEIEAFMVSQDTAVAVAFLLTEIIELALATSPTAQLRLSVFGTDDPARATVRVSSAALVETDELRELLGQRFGRVMEGLSRQLRSRLHHDPLVGAYEISVAVLGRE